MYFKVPIHNRKKKPLLPKISPFYWSYAKKEKIIPQVIIGILGCYG